MRPLRAGIALVATLVVASWLWFVWPTPWRYIALPARDMPGQMVPMARVHRVTGTVELLVLSFPDRMGEWRRQRRFPTP